MPVSGLEDRGSKQATRALPPRGYSQTGKDNIKAITAVTYSGLQGCAGVNVPARRPSPVCVRGAHAPDFHTQGMSFSWLLCTQCNVGTERAPTTADPPSATAGFGLPPSSLSSPGSHRVPLPWENEKKHGSPAMCGGRPGLPSPAWSAAPRRRALPPSSLGGTSPSAGVGGRYCRKRLSTRETSLALRLASSSEAAFFQRGRIPSRAVGFLPGRTRRTRVASLSAGRAPFCRPRPCTALASP